MTIEEIKKVYLESRSTRQAAWKLRIPFAQMKRIRKENGWPVLRNYVAFYAEYPEFRSWGPDKGRAEKKEPRIKKTYPKKMSIYDAVISG